MATDEADSIIWIESGVNQEGMPFCRVSLHNEPLGQLTPDEVRNMALAWLQAAEAAESDSAVFTELRAIGLDISACAAFIGELRDRRSGNRQDGLSTDEPPMG